MSTDKPLNVSIYGIGSFGYALLKHLDRKADDTFTLSAYDYDEKLMNHFIARRKHLYVQRSAKISERPSFAKSPEELLRKCDVLILAVSSDSTKEVMQNIRTFAKKPITIVNTAKALDKNTGDRLSKIASRELSGIDYSYAFLAGGTIANDLFKHEPLGIDLACDNAAVLKILQPIFESNNLHVYTTSDLAGVEYAAAFKNIISILAGIVYGLGFSYGAETHAISKTAQLIADACVQTLGADPETFSMGRQCWGNDLWMSSTGKTRNRQLGIMLGKGVPASEALRAMHSSGKLVEGVNTLQVLDKVKGIREIEPIKLLYDLLIDQSSDVLRIKNYLLRTHL